MPDISLQLELASTADIQQLQRSALSAFADDVEKYGSFPPNISHEEHCFAEFHLRNRLWQGFIKVMNRYGFFAVDEPVPHIASPPNE